MKNTNKYESPEIKVIALESEDIITTSPGDSPVVDWEW